MLKPPASVEKVLGLRHVLSRSNLVPVFRTQDPELMRYVLMRYDFATSVGTLMPPDIATRAADGRCLVVPEKASKRDMVPLVFRGDRCPSEEIYDSFVFLWQKAGAPNPLVLTSEERMTASCVARVDENGWVVECVRDPTPRAITNRGKVELRIAHYMDEDFGEMVGRWDPEEYEPWVKAAKTLYESNVLAAGQIVTLEGWSYPEGYLHEGRPEAAIFDLDLAAGTRP